MMPRKSLFAVILGNICEHYDAALFGLLAPLLAPLFFPSFAPLPALILTYAILPIGLLFRPLGALFFGYIGDTQSRKKALILSSVGIAGATFAMGCLPTYVTAGIWGPIALVVTRSFQAFCAAGESAGSAVIILEGTSQKHKGFFSSIFGASSIIGTVFAALLVMGIADRSDMHFAWRIPFFLGGVTALSTFITRLWLKEHHLTRQEGSSFSFLQLKTQSKGLIAVAVATGLAHVTYALAFTFMNGFVPLITAYSTAEMLQINTLLIICDAALLPVFGWFSDKIGNARMMRISAILLLITAFPLFGLLHLKTLWAIITARTLFMCLGISFSAPFYAWAQDQFPHNLRYRGLALSTAIGAQWLGAPTTAIMLWLYHATGWLIAPAFYVVLLTCLALATMRGPAYCKIKI